MLIANATMKKMGLQGLFIEDFEDKPMGLRLWGCVLSGGKKDETQDTEFKHLDS